MVVELEDRKLRLFKLVEHWAEHGQEHGERYLEAAAEAEEMGLGEVAEELRAAHRLTEEASKHLEKALSLGEG